MNELDLLKLFETDMLAVLIGTALLFPIVIIFRKLFQKMM